MAIKDKVVVITGASSGIGLATAKKLASEGARLVLGARREERLEELAGAYQQGQVIYKKTDVTNKDDVAALVNLGESTFGQIDVLYNNAGVMPISQLEELKVDEWEKK